MDDILKKGGSDVPLLPVFNGNIPGIPRMFLELS
jgi:hypothetical protein